LSYFTLSFLVSTALHYWGRGGGGEERNEKKWIRRKKIHFCFGQKKIQKGKKKLGGRRKTGIDELFPSIHNNVDVRRSLQISRGAAAFTDSKAKYGSSTRGKKSPAHDSENIGLFQFNYNQLEKFIFQKLNL